MKSRKEIKELAKVALSEQRGTAILLVFVYILASIASSGLDFLVSARFGQGVLYWVVFTVGLFILYVMGVNLLGEFFKIYRRENATVGSLFSGLKVNFMRKLGGTLWWSLWFLLWSLLLIIPGIVKACAYFFTLNILAVHPNVTARQALKISMRITQGHKKDVFVFVLSWFGWGLLSILTLGILYIVYVGPYFYTADGGLFLELRDKALAEGRITREELGMEEDKKQQYEQQS